MQSCFYFTANFVHKFAVKLCKFTARVSGELTKIHHNSPLKYVISPLNIAVKLHILAVNFGKFLLSSSLTRARHLIANIINSLDDHKT